MPKIIYQLNDGSTRTLEAKVGESVMQVAMSNSVPGIIGRCGGFCNCGTCHVYVGNEWVKQLPDPSFDEDALLDEVAAERLLHSRLGCQIKMTDALDGITVVVPEQQEF
ncbi:MAG: ferredoxin [Verrucomicrobiaceae bacterium]|nr:ferredoxin [Verrucomicrobiaceae bacterium]